LPTRRAVFRAEDLPFSPTHAQRRHPILRPIRRNLYTTESSQTAPLALSLDTHPRLAIGKVSFVAFVRTPRLHRTPVDRPERQLSIALLTNRTCRLPEPGIKKVRPAFHDALVEALGSNLEAQSLKTRSNQRGLRRLGTERANAASANLDSSRARNCRIINHEDAKLRPR